MYVMGLVGYFSCEETVTARNKKAIKMVLMICSRFISFLLSSWVVVDSGRHEESVVTSAGPFQRPTKTGGRFSLNPVPPSLASWLLFTIPRSLAAMPISSDGPLVRLFCVTNRLIVFRTRGAAPP